MNMIMLEQHGDKIKTHMTGNLFTIMKILENALIDVVYQCKSSDADIMECIESECARIREIAKLREAIQNENH